MVETTGATNVLAQDFIIKTNIKSRFNKQRNTSDQFIHLSNQHNADIDRKFKDKQQLTVIMYHNPSDLPTSSTRFMNRIKEGYIMQFVGKIVKVHSTRDGDVYYIKVPVNLEKYCKKWMHERESIEISLTNPFR
jgi:hypothetical protein